MSQDSNLSMLMAGCFLIRALYRGGFGNNELHYYLTNLVTGERVEVCRGQAVTDYLKVRVRLANGRAT